MIPQSEGRHPLLIVPFSCSVVNGNVYNCFQSENIRTSLVIETAGFLPVFIELGVNCFFCYNWYSVVHKIIAEAWSLQFIELFLMTFGAALFEVCLLLYF
jgi:hypothetical protein